MEEIHVQKHGNGKRFIWGSVEKVQLLKRDDLLYLAGIVDGEGCVSVTYGTKAGHERIRLTISNTDRNLIDWLAARLGGCITCTQSRGNRKPAYQWEVYSDKAFELLTILLPHLKLKHRQAELCLQFHTDESKRPWVTKQIRRMNARGKR